METILAQITTEFINKIFEDIGKEGLSQLLLRTTVFLKYAEELVLELMQKVIEETDKLLLENKTLRRPDGLRIQQRDVKRTVTTALGELEYSRTYYQYRSEDGETGYIYLADAIIGTESYERISKDLIAEILSDTVIMSYGKAAKNNPGNVSRQTVHNRLIAAKEFSAETERLQTPENGLDIFADEDHVHLRGTKDRKKKNVTVPLITVTEGIEESRTVNPFHIQGYGMDNDTLAENLLAVVCERYDMDTISSIRLHCDGGNWIRKIPDVLPNVTVYMDGFHIQKYLKRLLNLKEGSKYAKRIRDALEKCDWDSFFLYGTELMGLQDEKGQKTAEEILKYFHNNQKIIENRMKAKEEGVCGSCTEGLVSHTLSERLSRDPMGWSDEGLRKMSSLLIFTKNGGTVTPEHIRKSVSKEQVKEERSRFRENGFEKYRTYAKEQTDGFLQKKYDWSILEPASPTFGKVDAVHALLTGFGKTRDTFCA